MLFLLGVVIAISVLSLALANDDARFLLGQLVKIILCFTMAGACAVFVFVILLSRMH